MDANRERGKGGSMIMAELICEHCGEKMLPGQGHVISAGKLLCPHCHELHVSDQFYAELAKQNIFIVRKKQPRSAFDLLSIAFALAWGAMITISLGIGAMGLIRWTVSQLW
ncbi:MAG: hypothetical protein JXR97_12310 [Planctomycetes bacterium]|nr:hypothetical protein [Planctomycetota bacterium]